VTDDRREWFMSFSACCSAVLWLHSMVGSTAYQRRCGSCFNAARPICFGSIWEEACCWWVRCIMLCACVHTGTVTLFWGVVEPCFSVSNEVEETGLVATICHKVNLVITVGSPVNITGHFC
jgi:hypothetical protein